MTYDILTSDQEYMTYAGRHGKEKILMKTEFVYFSATGTTGKYVKAIAEGLGGEVCFTDITLPENRKSSMGAGSDLIVIAVPVYGERIPRFLYDYMKQTEGNGRFLAVAAVYGNMGYGISLEQFRDFAEQNHFRLIAAAALIGQHTYASKEAPVAYGRPDREDLQEAVRFGMEIQKKLSAGGTDAPVIPESRIPKWVTRFPDTGTRFLIRQPAVKKRECNSCGACVRRCPAGAIDPDTLVIDEEKCLRCYACVKVCARKARAAEFLLPVFQMAFDRIGRKRKNNMIFL